MPIRTTRITTAYTDTGIAGNSWETYEETIGIWQDETSMPSFSPLAQVTIKYAFQTRNTTGFRIKIRFTFDADVWSLWKFAINSNYPNREEWIAARRPVRTFLKINTNTRANTLYWKIRRHLESRGSFLSNDSQREAVALIEHIRGQLKTLSDPNYVITPYAPPTFTCLICNATEVSESNIRYVIMNGNTRQQPICVTCQDDLETCHRCGHGLSEGYAIYSERDDMAYCEDCYTRTPRIEAFSYKPTPDFRPEKPTNPKLPFYIGLELETEVKGNLTVNSPKVTSWINSLQEEESNLIYAKSDSSISNGVELVTHPAEPKWMIEHFPFHKFQEALDADLIMPTHKSCGTHIHISKAAFGPAHMWKFIQVHLKLPNFAGMVGGRGIDEEYGCLGEGYTKKELVRKANLIAKYKGDLSKANLRDIDRSFGINLWPSTTIELRYPRGATEPPEIKKNIEWVDCLFHFTRYLNVQDVKNGAIDDPGYLMGWMYDRQPEFPNLVEWVDKRTPSPKKLANREE